MLTHAWLRHVMVLWCGGIFPPGRFGYFPSLFFFFFSTFYTLISLQEWREEAGEVEEVQKGNFSGGSSHLRSVYVFFTLVVDLFVVIANCLFFH